MNLAIALGIGLLLGVERERRKGEGPERAFAGIRTFGLVSLLGGIARILGEGVLVVTAVFVAAGALLAYALSTRRLTDPGITSEVAVVAAFLLGALAQSEPALASGLAVIATALLASRYRLHGFVRGILTEEELRDALLLAVAALVVLPLLPNEVIDPYEVVNPFTVWRLVVLVMLVSSAGYVAIRALGPRHGLPVAGLAAGFVSAIATVGAMGARRRAARRLHRPAVAGAVLATVATVVQMVMVVGATSLAVLREPAMAIGLACAGAATVLYGALFALRAIQHHEDARLEGQRAFDLRAALLFALIVTAVLFAGAFVEDLLGEAGVVITAAVAGLADSHAAAISVVSLVSAGKIEAEAAVVPVLVGLSTNTLVKAVVAYVAGGPRFALEVGCGLALFLAAAWAGMLVAAVP